MKILAQFTIALALLTYAPVASGNSTEIKEEYFTVQIPEGFKLDKEVAVESDIFYSISLRNHIYVQIYVGNAPKFPQIADPSDPNITVLKTNRMSMLSKWHGNEIVGLETLIVRVPGLDWPRVVQAWTVAEAPDKKVAQRILLSLVVETATNE